MDDHDQHVFLGTDPEQDRAQREFGGQVEAVRDGLVDRAGQVPGRHLDHPQSWVRLFRRQDS